MNWEATNIVVVTGKEEPIIKIPVPDIDKLLVKILVDLSKLQDET